MKKLIVALLLAAAPVLSLASGGAVHLESANNDLSDKTSLQRGAKYFVNYCQGCHTLKYFRYEKLKDFDLTEEEIKDNLMMFEAKIGEQMKNAMDVDAAAKWFGAPPPDLSLETRMRHGGADWVYSYLKSFYIDEKRPFGVNNTVFKDVGMPHVLADLQGLQRAKFAEETDAEGNVHHVFEGFEQAEAGKLNAEEYDAVIRDLANFLEYVGEPVKLERQRIGMYVLAFLAVLFVLAYRLKKEYWKDVH